MRVLHCPTNTAGHAMGLATAQRALGVHSWCVSFMPNYLNYPADEVWGLTSKKMFYIELKRWQLLLRSMTKFDVIHFDFGQTLMPQRMIKAPSGVKKNSHCRYYSQLGIHIS